MLVNQGMTTIDETEEEKVCFLRRSMMWLKTDACLLDYTRRDGPPPPRDDRQREARDRAYYDDDRRAENRHARGRSPPNKAKVSEGKNVDAKNVSAEKGPNAGTGGEEDAESEMMAAMGFGNFGSTKVCGTSVAMSVCSHTSTGEEGSRERGRHR